MITVFPIISRNVNKYKEVYPNLYNDFEVARKNRITVIKQLQFLKKDKKSIWH